VTFRYLHTGDIHLDSPLKGLAGQEGAAAERIRTATRAAFDNLVTQAIEEGVDFVIIAGDLYDGDWRDYRTGLFFVRQMGRLAKAHIPVFLLYGNHDAESQITRRLALPNNVHVFSARKPQTFQLETLGVALHGHSFRQRDITDNIVPAYPPRLEGFFNIGVLHTSLGGMPGHTNYAPCTLDELINKGYNYWALAHVHQAVVLHEKPHVVFCGNLQGRHIREAGSKSAFLVAVEDGQVDTLTPVHADVVRWIRLPIAVESCSAMGNVVDLIRKTIEDAVARESHGRLLACRLELTGRTALHAQLVACADNLLAEAQAAALGLGEEAAWIERVNILSEDLEAPGFRMDALGDLQRMISGAALDTSLQAQLAADLGDLIRKLPHEVRADPDDAVLRAAVEGDHAGLIAHVGSYLMARLEAEKV
jgi:DNA repair exonuclease SbcCD nuclease subunit